MSALQDVLLNPRSVLARRVLADEWQRNRDPRYELIRGQLLDHDQVISIDIWTILDRITDLLAVHGREWAGRVVEWCNSYEFELGLVTQVDIDANAFIEHGAELVTVAPILHLLVGAPIDIEKLCAMPALRQISTLIFEGGDWIGDREAQIFASSPNVRGVRVAALCGGRMTDVGLRALAASPNLPDLVYIDVTGNPATETAYRGVPGMEIDGSYYLLGDAASPYLRKAQADAARSYDPMKLSGWPPSWTDVAWTERERPADT